MKKTKKINSMLVIAIGVAIAITFITAQNANITANSIKIIYFPQTADFQNDKQGTIVFDFLFPENQFSNQNPDKLLLLDSKIIPGLSVQYDVNKKLIIAGLPQLSSQEINIIDGKRHMLIYSFDKNSQKQSIYLDGNILTEGKYAGKAEQMPTGLSIYKKKEMIESNVPITITIK